MMLLEKTEDSTKTNYATPQRPQRLPQGSGLWSFYQTLSVSVSIIVVFLLFVASAKPHCGKNQYLVQNTIGSASCFGCPTCPPGQSLFPECGNVKPMSSSTLVDCVPCRLGVSFSRGHDTSPCTPCSFCAQDQVVEQNCSLQNNIKCAKQCHSKNRYYDDSKGACLHCSKCCGDDQDVVEHECREKLGAGSSMICSFHSSVNRCDRSTTTAHKSSSTLPNKSPANTPAATPDHTPALTNTSARKDSKFDIITTPSSLVGNFSSQRKDYNDSHVSITIVTFTIVVLLALIMSGGTILWVCKSRPMRRHIWYPGRDVYVGIDPAATKNSSDGNLDTGAQVKLGITCALYKPGAGVSNESYQPLIKKGDREVVTDHTYSCQNVKQTQSARTEVNVGETSAGVVLVGPSDPPLKEDGREVCTCSCQRSKQAKTDSKLLSSLLDSNELKTICDSLDVPIAGSYSYEAIARYYGANYWKIKAGFKEEKSEGVITWLVAEKPELTLREFASDLRKVARRNDVAQLLEGYDSESIKEVTDM